MVGLAKRSSTSSGACQPVVTTPMDGWTGQCFLCGATTSWADAVLLNNAVTNERLRALLMKRFAINSVPLLCKMHAQMCATSEARALGALSSRVGQHLLCSGEAFHNRDRLEIQAGEFLELAWPIFEQRLKQVERGGDAWCEVMASHQHVAEAAAEVATPISKFHKRPAAFVNPLHLKRPAAAKNISKFIQKQVDKCVANRANNNIPPCRKCKSNTHVVVWSAVRSQYKCKKHNCFFTKRPSP